MKNKYQQEVEVLSEEEAFRNLATAIVIQAVKDWRKLCRKREPNDKFTGLRQFFRSDWCALLCGRVDPLLILEMLEKERIDEDEKTKEDYANVKLD